MLRRQSVYKQIGGFDSVTPENKAKIDAMSNEERGENSANWAQKMGYGQRAIVESWFSGKKRVIGDEIKARTPAGMEQELLLKVGIYNLMNDDALANGHTPTRVVVNEGWAGSKGRRKKNNGREANGSVKAKKGVG